MRGETVKIGTRGSKLALYQANRVKDELDRQFPEFKTEIVIIKTKGDKILDVALSKIGDKGLFTKELEIALDDGKIDMAVHSLKDMPTELPSGLKLGAVLERGIINDAFVSLNKKPLSEFTESDKIATSSLRRIANLRHINPKFQIVDIRGNVQTRLQKMNDGHCRAMIMAATALKRLEMEEIITEIISPEVMIPAVSQGAIGIEIREGDQRVAHFSNKINHEATWKAITAERSFMHRLQGGCQIPVGCYSIVDGGTITLKGFVSDIDANVYLKEQHAGPITKASVLGAELAEKLLAMGGDKILKEIRESL